MSSSLFVCLFVFHVVNLITVIYRDLQIVDVAFWGFILRAVPGVWRFALSEARDVSAKLFCKLFRYIRLVPTLKLFKIN